MDVIFSSFSPLSYNESRYAWWELVLPLAVWRHLHHLTSKSKSFRNVIWMESGSLWAKHKTRRQCLAAVRHVAALAWSFTYVLRVNVPLNSQDCFLEAQNQIHIVRMPQHGSSSLHPSFRLQYKCVPKTIWWPCLGRNINYNLDKAPFPVTVSQVQPRVSERSDEVEASPFVCTTAMGDYTQRALWFVRLILSRVRPFVFV